MDREAATGSKIRILVLDSSLIHTQLLADALRDHEMEVTGVDSAKDLISKALDPAINVLVISATLGEGTNHGLQLLRQVRASRPDIRAVVLLDSPRPEVVLDAFRAGARGVFCRFDSVEKLCKCVQCVHSGQIWANNHELTIALQALGSAPTLQVVDANGLNLLSKRELEIVQSLAEGLTNREIAGKLGLSQHTVKNYLFRIFDKLGVSNRLELLFMILSRPGNSQAAFSGFLTKCNEAMADSNSVLQECQQAAEQGSPIAQLVLAQAYWSRKKSAADIVLAYKWYLITSAQLLQASKTMKTRMTMEQLLQAERMAAEWLRKNQKIPPSSIPLPSERTPVMRMAD